MIKRPLSDSPLTAEERVFAEAHHNLMYRYMRIHDLDIEEWYDRLIIAYLNSVTAVKKLATCYILAMGGILVISQKSKTSF